MPRSGKRVTKPKNNVLLKEYITNSNANVSMEIGNQNLQATQ
jgi:hypothetical protein